MTIGIYCIEHISSSKKYIGKTKNSDARFWAHKNALVKIPRPKDCNRHLYNAVQKYWLCNFKFYIIEEFDIVNEKLLAERELYWMDFYKTCERKFGYNLRRDSSTGMIHSSETIELMKVVHLGENNGNYGNRWNEEQKLKMSLITKERHKSGKYYTEKTRRLNSEASKKTWSNLEKRKQMAKAVSKAKEKYDFYQYTKEMVFIKKWFSIEEIIKINPEYKWQNIYAVCNGYKPTYMSFIWIKLQKNMSW